MVCIFWYNYVTVLFVLDICLWFSVRVYINVVGHPFWSMYTNNLTNTLMKRWALIGRRWSLILESIAACISSHPLAIGKYLSTGWPTLSFLLTPLGLFVFPLFFCSAYVPLMWNSWNVFITVWILCLLLLKLTQWQLKNETPLKRG